MRLIICAFLFACTNICIAKDYIPYYKQVLQAEESMYNADFEKALKHYDLAFSQYEFKFARDCMIAAQIAAYLKKDEQVYKYLVYCLEAGVSYDCLFKPKVLKPYATSDIAKKLDREKDRCRTKYLSRIDTALNKEFTRRYDLEQFIKNKGGEPYYKVVDNNVDRIRQFLQTGKFPGEQLVGLKNSVVQSNKPSLFGPGDCYYHSELALPSLLHFPYSKDSFDVLLLKARDAGYLSPWEYVSIYIFSSYRVCIYRDSKYLPGVVPSMVFNLPFEKTKTDLATANANRAKYFLPRIDRKLNRDSLLYNYGIAVGIGDYGDIN